MFFKPIPASKSFVSQLNDHLKSDGKNGLSARQSYFIALIITSMVLLRELCWASMARAMMNHCQTRALSWMLHRSKIPWEHLWIAALTVLFKIFKVTRLYLIIDDTFRARSKNTKKIYGVFKTIDKRTGGYIKAQNIIFIAVVTPVITIPIWFWYYRPDPVYASWEKNDKKLRKKVSKKNRPKAPERDFEKYPSRNGIAVLLLKKAQDIIFNISIATCQPIKVSSILADAAYLSKEVTKGAKKAFPKSPLVSQLKKNQLCHNKTSKKKPISEYFANMAAKKDIIKIRGSEEKTIYYCGARLFIKSHGKVMHLIALKYEGEQEYRYLAATDLTWRTLDIIKAYTFRWLIEVAIEDWKQYGGFGRKAPQQGVDGACRGVFLSLLVDCFLLSHPHQRRLYLTGKSLCTTASLVRAIQLESLLNTVKEILNSPDPHAALKELVDNLPNVAPLMPSDKHMAGREIEDLGPSPHLQKKYGQIIEEKLDTM
jgi:hypothetical protein